MAFPPMPPPPLFRFTANDGTVVGEQLARIQGMTPPAIDEPSPNDIQQMLRGNLQPPPPAAPPPVDENVMMELVRDLGIMGRDNPSTPPIQFG